VKFFNNHIRTPTGIFVSHMLSLMQKENSREHSIHFITLNPQEVDEKVKEVVTGTIHHFQMGNF